MSLPLSKKKKMRKNLQNISLSYWKLIVNNKDLLICYMYYTCHFYTLLLFVTALNALRGIHWGNVSQNGIMTVHLSHGQAEIISLACKGHNLFVTGQGGTGKSTVVREIISNLQAVGRKVSVVCSSGIACTVYDPGVASTVHSYYGLGIADLFWGQLVERSSKNSVVIEASMSSQRMLELVNAIHHRLRDNKCNRPFGGKQLILVGEFLQLRPVPNDLDEGSFMFLAPIFQNAITHRYELTEVLRQNNLEFLSVLKDIRVGKCSENSLDYLRSLSRPLETPQDEISHIYFKRLPVALHNRLALQNLPLPEFTF